MIKPKAFRFKNHRAETMDEALARSKQKKGSRLRKKAEQAKFAGTLDIYNHQ